MGSVKFLARGLQAVGLGRSFLYNHRTGIRYFGAGSIIIFYASMMLLHPVIFSPEPAEAQLVEATSVSNSTLAERNAQVSQEITIARLEYRVQVNEERIRALEQAKPELTNQTVKNVMETVEKQQTLLYGIAAAVIINLLTGNSKLPFRISRNKREEDDGSTR